MRVLDFSSEIPMFRFGNAQTSKAVTFGIIGGGLIMDNGEAERTFIYRCQDRFLTYTWLCGWNSLFFAIDERQVATYQRAITSLSGRLRLALRRCRLALDYSTPQPLFVILDPSTLRIRMTSETLRTLQLIAKCPPCQSPTVAMNQVSPTYAYLLEQLQSASHSYGVALSNMHEGQPASELGRLAMAFHDKANYVSLSRHLDSSTLAFHVPTAVLKEDDIRRICAWDDLVETLHNAVGQVNSKRIYVKASRYSAGNLSVSLSCEDFEARWLAYQAEITREIRPTDQDFEASVRELRADIEMAPCMRGVEFTDEMLREFRVRQAQLRQQPQFLVQPELSSGVSVGSCYNGIGMTYAVSAAGGIHVATYAHLFRDPERKHFLGAYLTNEIATGVDPRLFGAVQVLCHALADRGYRGPVNFDARIGPSGDYRLIYDCNPRMTGAFPSLVIARFLQLLGCSVTSVLTLGYRGDLFLTHFENALRRLEETGVLWSSRSSQGAIVLPNLCRENGYDVHLINVNLSTAKRLLAASDLLPACSTNGPLAFYH